MRKALVLVAVFVGLVALSRLLGSRMQGVDWEQVFERMPDNAPPKWMFNNVSAIRENTDRIIDLLEHQPSRST